MTRSALRAQTPTKNQTTRRRFRPMPHASLMVPIHSEKTALVFLPTQPRTIHVCWLDERDGGKSLGCTIVHLKPGTTYYFLASPLTLPEHPDYRYFYLLQYSESRGRAACSCSTGWVFPRTQVACEHMQQLLQSLTASTQASETTLISIPAHEEGGLHDLSAKAAGVSAP
jgi:hypothetical protein